MRWLVAAGSAIFVGYFLGVGFWGARETEAALKRKLKGKKEISEEDIGHIAAVIEQQAMARAQRAETTEGGGA